VRFRRAARCGAPDADYRDEGQQAVLGRGADAVLAGEEPGRPEIEPVGYSLKWRRLPAK
jgi:hypothetical protein